jgi:hypothetical protein
MKKTVLLFSILFIVVLSSKADFNIWGSAVYLNINGSSQFYNTQKLQAPYAIGQQAFSGTLGVFGYSSGTFKLMGAEINASKDNNYSICSGNLYYTDYLRVYRPVNPVFASLGLGIYCTCIGGTFNSCGNGSCIGSNDQKLQSVDNSIDLTGYAIGDYTLELYYSAIGHIANGACDQQRFDNATGSNYKADFSITAPLALNLSALNAIVGDNDVKIVWSIQNDVDITNYEVQKSENGLTFSTINSVGSNQRNTPSNYFVDDVNPVIGSNYYRIKVNFINGTVSLSKVFRSYFGNVGNTLFIYPNPSGAELAVRFADVTKGSYQLSVLNNLGQRIITMPLYHDGNDKTIKVSIPVSLSRGMYRLFLIDKTHFYRQSFLIK